MVQRNRKLSWLLAAVCTAGFLWGTAVRAGEADDASADVKVIWKKNCAVCHGEDGKGNTTVGRKMQIVDLTSKAIQTKYGTDPEQIAKLISEGYSKKGKSIMKPLKDKLKKEEITSLSKYVLQLGKPAKK